jgi:hypothetical protein
MKKCSKCKEIKHTDQFNRNKSRKDGLQCYCRDCEKECGKKWRKGNTEYIKQSNKQWKEDNSDHVKEYNKKYNKDNTEQKQAKDREWKDNNRDHLAQYRKNKRKNDSLYKLICNIRSNVGQSFKRACKGMFRKESKTQDILGCDFNFFINHIASQFAEGMALDNHGEWHLDHKIPLSTAQTEEDIIRLCHYTNYQPLWAKDNMKKHNKLY